MWLKQNGTATMAEYFKFEFFGIWQAIGMWCTS